MSVKRPNAPTHLAIHGEWSDSAVNLSTPPAQLSLGARGALGLQKDFATSGPLMQFKIDQPLIGQRYSFVASTMLYVSAFVCRTGRK